MKATKTKTSRPSSVAVLRRVDATKAFEKALAALPTAKCVLRLYVAGATDKSRQAVVRARQLCETELKGNFELEVIDVYQQPILARDGQIVATPTLVREFPKPVRRLIGNLANTTRLSVGLDLVTKGKTGR
jgi:circadian clock protein KaiB